MNENKEGKKYRYPNSFILVIGYITIYLHLPYRQTEGIIKGHCCLLSTLTVIVPSLVDFTALLSRFDTT